VERQADYWKRRHEGVDRADADLSVSRFAMRVADVLDHDDTLLELGCGTGADAGHLARHCARVVATDVSEHVLRFASSRHDQPDRVLFTVLDTTEPLPFADAVFTAVYSHMSLHYFTDDQMWSVVAELTRILTPGGRLFLLGRSTRDPLHGRGRRLARDVYVLNGHLRRVLAEDDMLELLDGGFDKIEIEEQAGKIYGFECVVLQVTAERRWSPCFRPGPDEEPGQQRHNGIGREVRREVGQRGGAAGQPLHHGEGDERRAGAQLTMLSAHETAPLG
jgi:SAM-dependent methyltransferase